MAEAATLADVTKKLGDIETAVKSGGDDSATDRAKAAEETKEAAVKEDERTSIFQSISDKLNIFKGMKGDDFWITFEGCDMMWETGGGVDAPLEGEVGLPSCLS